MNEHWIMRYAYVGVACILLWALVKLWIQPEEKVQRTVDYIAAAAIVIIAIRIFVWAIGVG